LANILLLEDDIVLAETLVELLESEGFNVVHLHDGEMVIERTFEQSFDLYLFDINVPKLSGFELLKILRESSDKTPTIFLTAMSDIASLSKGFDVGADDYIKKPFDFDELIVRIHALLRKSYKTKNILKEVGNFSFNIEKEELYKEGVFIPLSPYELKITQLFFKNVDKTLLKEEILLMLSDGSEVSEGALRVHITKLRKIGLSITTIKGLGYRFASV